MEIGDWSFGIELWSEDCFDDAKFGPIYRQKNVKEEQKEKTKAEGSLFQANWTSSMNIWKKLSSMKSKFQDASCLLMFTNPN